MSHSGGPPEIEGMTSLKVDNLTYRTKPEDLHKVFSKYGDVGDVYIPRDRYSKESRGFAFVRFYDKRDAEDAMDYMDGAVMDGRDLRVQMARYGRPSADYNRRPRSRYDRGGGGGGGRYGGSGGGRRGRDSRSRSRSRSRGRRGRSRSRSPRRKSSPYRRRRSPSRSRSRSRSASHHSHSPAKRRSASHSRSRSGSKSPRQKTRSRSRSGSYAKGD